MPLVCLGLSHHTAPVEVRERHAFPPSKMGEALVALHDYEVVREAVMLQTCGRLEIYAEIADYEDGIRQLKSFLQNYRHAMVGYDLDSYLYTLLGQDAAGHLMRVSTGLDSMLIGEAEILSQVKDAYAAAHRSRSLGPVLHRLFREAMASGKAARSQTSIGDESPSVATAAIELAVARLGGLNGRSVTIVGAGKMGRIAAKRFRSEGARELVVVNRTVERAQDVVDDAGTGEAADLPQIAHAMANADVVVTSTGSPNFLLTPAVVEQAMRGRPERPLLVLDIAVPRDADPAIAGIDGVTLIGIDDLKSHVDRKLDVRRAAIPDVEEIIAEYCERFARWFQGRGSDPVIASLTKKAEAIRSAELERLFARLPDLTEREKMLISGASLTIISKLLHSVVTNVREKADDDREGAGSRARLLEELFELDIADP